MTSSDGGIVYDRQAIPFGLRRLDVEGIHWKLNGRWLYLHGYGDDSIYPATVAPPANYTFYKRRLHVARSLGFNCKHW